MEKNKQVVDTGEVVCGFGVRKDYEGLGDFDQTYKEVTIKQRVKKIGDGDTDFIIEDFEEIKEIPIDEVIKSQQDEVGIEAFMRPYLAQGIEPPSVEVSENINDFSMFPEDPSDAIKIGDDMMKQFNALDPALRGDAKTPEEFLASLTKEKFEAYLMSKVNKNVEKVEENKDVK